MNRSSLRFEAALRIASGNWDDGSEPSLTSRPDQRAEHLIVAATNTSPGVVVRPRYRLTIEGPSPPWVTLRAEVTDDATNSEVVLDDSDILEIGQPAGRC